MIVFYAAVILCVGLQRLETMYSKSRKSNFVLDYGIQRCQITEVAFYTEVLINNILVSLERVLDYTDVG